MEQNTENVFEILSHIKQMSSHITWADFDKIETFGLPWKIDEGGTWADIDLPNCVVTIYKRPTYCDRGRYGVYLDGKANQTKIDIDAADGFPRYFFKLQNLFDELNEWVIFNKEVKDEQKGT